MRDRGAMRALVLGLLALWFGVLAPFAVLAAARSLRRIRHSGGELTGAELATGGLAAGILALAVIVAGVLYWVVIA